MHIVAFKLWKSLVCEAFFWGIIFVLYKTQPKNV